MKRALLAALIFVGISATAQQRMDVQHYTFDLDLSDASDTLRGVAIIRVRLLQPLSSIGFDLAGVKNGKGMTVSRVRLQERYVKDLTFTQSGDRLTINFGQEFKKGEETAVVIHYSGIPSDGLIIARNKFGERTFFADNWPDRAHNWIPCADAPGDKASFAFIVRAPAHYTVIANGRQLTGTEAHASFFEKPGDGKRTWHFEETIPLPTKVMVIGAADFAVKKYEDSPSNLPITAYVYRQDSAKGVYDFSAAPSVVKFFSNYIAPFPYTQLANVQSKTIFGGMENAGAIFYAESAVTGKGREVDLVAHEIAHQWFGDMASEKTFTHLWLSEGFASYLTNIYLQYRYGGDTLAQRMKTARAEIIPFARTHAVAVVDSTTPYMELLNANSYQKGSWVLHMLRGEVGDEIFQKILQAYYARYKGGNADSRDFEAVAEQVCKKELTWFFDQWLYRPGIPKLDIEIKNDSDEVKIRVKQLNGVYRLQLPYQVMAADGSSTKGKLSILEKEAEVNLKVKGPAKVVIDPDTQLLFERK